MDNIWWQIAGWSHKTTYTASSYNTLKLATWLTLYLKFYSKTFFLQIGRQKVLLWPSMLTYGVKQASSSNPLIWTIMNYSLIVNFLFPLYVFIVCAQVMLYPLANLSRLRSLNLSLIISSALFRTLNGLVSCMNYRLKKIVSNSYVCAGYTSSRSYSPHVIFNFLCIWKYKIFCPLYCWLIISTATN